MNSYYVEYFRDMRSITSEELGALMRGEQITEENRRTNAGYANSIIREYPKLDNDTIEKLAKVLEVSPLWFTCAPCLLSIEDLHYYLKTVPDEQDPEGRGNLSNILIPVQDKDSAVAFKFEISNGDLAQALATYQNQKKAFWNGSLTPNEWNNWRLGCLKKSPEFKAQKGRTMRDFINMYDDLTLTQCAEKMVAHENSENNAAYSAMISAMMKRINNSVKEMGLDEAEAKELANERIIEEQSKLKAPEAVTKQNMLRRMRKYFNGVAEPPRRFAKNFCDEFKDYGMTLDLWHCDFYFSSWEDFYNLIVVADIMVCPVVFSNVDKKAFITFDKKIFTSAIAMPIRNIVANVDTYDDSDDDEDDEDSYEKDYRARMIYDAKAARAAGGDPRRGARG